MSVNLFDKMFIDSVVAKEMKLHKDKISLVSNLVFGIALYFKDLLQLLLTQDDTHYVIWFDKSLNKAAHR